MGNNFSKTQITCTLTALERKKIDNIKYAEVLTPNLIKTSTRKNIIYKTIQFHALNHEEYLRQKQMSY